MAARTSREVVGKLLRDLGDERHLAERIIDLRRERGWSQDALAIAMREAGVPIPQSAISKIEKPAPGGRRAITVGEALAFAKVFQVSLDELLLPPEALQWVELMQNIAAGPSALKARDRTVAEYEALVLRTAHLMLESRDAATLVADEFDKIVDEVAAQGREGDDSFKWTFMKNVIDAYNTEKERQ